MAEITDQQAGMSSLHHVVVIDVEAEAEADGEAAATPPPSSSSSCVVCMEPMEWMTVAPCGHHEVCVRCAARIRFFHNDRRCCICRTHCATVVVTRADVADRASAPAALVGGQGLAAGVYWYHGGMGAYFDHLSQYEEMSKVCVAAASPRSEGAAAGAGVVRHQQPAASSVNAVYLNAVSSAPARQADHADAAQLELERPFSRRQETAGILILGVAGVFILGAPLLYMIPT